MVLAVLLLPQLLVVAWSAMERDIGGKLQWSARATADDAADVLRISEEEGAEGALVAARLAEIAARHTARIRVVRKDGEERFDVDRDQGTDLVHQVGTLFFGPDGAPTLREFDDTLGPVEKRAEVVKVTGWAAAGGPASAGAKPALREGGQYGSVPTEKLDADTGCRTSPAGKLLVCHAARAVALRDGEIAAIYVQESSRRAVRALYDLRYHLLRLSLLSLPLVLLFQRWMGRRMVYPIEWLRERVLEKARSKNARGDLEPPPGAEVEDLARAFNGLLSSLDEQRRENEAFIADLVHEFKNPVAAIRACAEALDAGGVDEKRATRLAKILADSSTRLDALVSQFLELARAEAGMPNEARGPVDVAALARGVTSSVEPAHPGVRFVIEADDAAVVEGVDSRLGSVVRNLVDNAASFAGEGGEVRVCVVKRAGDVILEVSDTGPGIPEADLPRMFERFFTTRAVASEGGGAGGAEPSARRQKGTGLGLALVKAIAEAHGGSVGVRSSPGEGATFHVTLPAG